MKSYRNLWQQLCSSENLLLAFQKARKGKTQKIYVKDFEKNLKENLLRLKIELVFHYYKPKKLTTFVIRDPKTRKISKSTFRDRVIHHAICNILEPIYENYFIYDSYANRKGKGTLKAIERFDYFKRKVSKNNTKACYILKADIKQYFETVDHQVLIAILQKKIKDKRLINLIKIILNNYETKEKGKGMPLGNLTSQFFANVYLHELDHFVKHKLKIKYYVRYVDDFVIFESSQEKVMGYQKQINSFLNQKLYITLHEGKTKVISLERGVTFLGLRIFYHHRLLKKSNLRKIQRRIQEQKQMFENKKILYDSVYNSLEGVFAYLSHANTHTWRERTAKKLEKLYAKEVSSKEVNRLLKYTNKKET